MKIIHKLPLGFSIVVLLIFAIGFYAADRSQKTLYETIGNNYMLLATESMYKIDMIIESKIEAVQAYSRDLIVLDSLIESNNEFEEINDIQGYIDRQDKAWVSAPAETVTPFMSRLINNDLAEELKRKKEFYDEHHGHTVFGEIFVTNKYGANVAQTGKTSDYRQDDEEWWQIAKEKGINVSDVEFDKSAAIYAIDICVRIEDDAGNFLGVIKTVLDLGEVIGTINELQKNSYYKSATFDLITNEGRSIYKTKSFEAIEELSGTQLSHHQDTGREGYEIIKSGKGDKLVIHTHSRGFHEYKGFDWVLVTELDTAEILAPAVSLRNNLLAATFGIAFIAILMSLLISRSISNPLSKLRDIVSEIGKGTLDAKAEIKSNDEIGQLSRAFVNMTNDLKRSTTSIDRLNVEIAERERAEADIRMYTQMKDILNKILHFALKDIPLKEMLEQVIKYIINTDYQWITLEPKGAVFLVEDDPEVLVMKAQTGLPEPLLNICSRIPFGRCLCGRAALSGKTEFADCVDERHENRYDGISPHGHYCVPIMSGDKVLGVLNLYSKAGHVRNEKEEGLLSAVADSLAGIIERKKMERTLSDQQDRLSAIIDSSTDAIISINSHGSITSWSPAAETLFGYSADEMMGKPITIIQPEKYRGAHLENIQRFITMDKSMLLGKTLETTALNKDNKEFPIEISLSTWKLENDRYFTAFIRDIFQRKELETALEKEIAKARKSQKELQEAYDKLKSTHSQLLQQEKMASIGQLAAGVAHEINNPMGFISSNLVTLRKYIAKISEFINALTEAINNLNGGEPAEELREKRRQLKIDYILGDIAPLIAESLEGAERVKVIVQNLKSFSRVDEAEHKMADMNECMESTLNIIWNELKYKATVKKEYGEIPLTKCYPQQLNQVFMNLLVNAVQSIEKQGDISIKTWSEDGSIYISISDTGDGIPEDKVDRIFEPFFTTKEVGKGTGLGLSIIYDIVKKHDGDITVKSEVGKGTTFTVTMPVIEGK